MDATTEIVINFFLSLIHNLHLFLIKKQKITINFVLKFNEILYYNAKLILVFINIEKAYDQ